MARSFFINGESLVLVKGRSDGPLGALTQLGLTEDPVRVSIEERHRPIIVNATGEVEPETQFMGASATITMNLIHFDRTVIDYCLMESMGGAPNNTPGQMARAGTTLGNGAARFAAGGPFVGNYYIGLNIASPVAGKPWRFYYTFLTGNPFSQGLGTEKSIIQLTWRAIPYVADPWNNGVGLYGVPLYDFTSDT